jgi:beta-1,4-mannosyl-glycoprotein beta-1,4-N-acetylglucosaminyltransferase
MNESYQHKELILISFVVLTGLYFVHEVFYLHDAFFSDKQPVFDLPETINCSIFGFNDLPTSKIPIYDSFLFDHELDMLEIRLHELYDYVTLFLIVESDQTFSGKRKPLYLKENWSRFAKYHDKIRHVEININDNSSSRMGAGDREANSRYNGIQLALPKSSKY